MYIVVVRHELGDPQFNFIDCIQSFHLRVEALKFCSEWDDFFNNYPCNGNCTIYNFTASDHRSFKDFLSSLEEV